MDHAAAATVPPSLKLESPRLIAQGAEALVFAGTYCGRRAVAKHRFSKGYRHPLLDHQVRRRRTKAEARALALNEEVSPALLHVDSDLSTLYLARVEGQTVAALLTAPPASTPAAAATGVGAGADPAPAPAGFLHSAEGAALARSMGRAVARMHGNHTVHNDLTTSNFLYNATEDRVYIVDYGLASTARASVEARAVDLQVLERSLLALCGESRFFEHFLAGYAAASGAEAAAVLARLGAVRTRGRKKGADN